VKRGEPISLSRGWSEQRLLSWRGGKKRNPAVGRKSHSDEGKSAKCPLHARRKRRKALAHLLLGKKRKRGGGKEVRLTSWPIRGGGGYQEKGKGKYESSLFYGKRKKERVCVILESTGKKTLEGILTSLIE